jgi:hypothetical protein
VLHQEQEAGAANLISRAAAAVRPGGQVAVVDFSIDERQHASVVGALFAINMRSFGDTYTESAIRRWMIDAGLNEITRRDIGIHRWLFLASRINP